MTSWSPCDLFIWHSTSERFSCISLYHGPMVVESATPTERTRPCWLRSSSIMSAPLIFRAWNRRVCRVILNLNLSPFFWPFNIFSSSLAVECNAIQDRLNLSRHHLLPPLNWSYSSCVYSRTTQLTFGLSFHRPLARSNLTILFAERKDTLEDTNRHVMSPSIQI